jgi:hypothetical protein
MSHKVLFVLGLALVVVAAALVIWDLDSPRHVSAQDGGGDCKDPCPAWIEEAWAGSAHANAESEPFRHWDAEDPKEVPVTCAKCHSEAGYLDFLGADGTAAGTVENPAPVDTVVSCTACHNPVTVGKTSVVFPSGVEITGLDKSARCMECHQGRASTQTVNDAIAKAAVDVDVVSADLGFVNIHYFAAAASLFGSEVHGAYEYEGQSYAGKNLHVPGYDSCAQCHNPHSLQVKVTECAACHTNVATKDDLKTIRMNGSLVDYDGDGDMTEGIFGELEGLQAVLLEQIMAYANEVAAAPIAYDAAAYPYFFADANANGTVDEGETKYVAFTPRLLQAAYNFQAYEKDPGAFAHNGEYWAEILYDSIANLNEKLAAPKDLVLLHRNPPGHFDATAEAFRHWDADGEVPGGCARCHAPSGLPTFIHNGVNIAAEPGNGLACSTCHANFQDFARYTFEAVPFPNGAKLAFENAPDANLCISCHQGRESTVSVNRLIGTAGVGDDEVSDKLRFLNVHYFAAGATLFGSAAQGIYQYADKEYLGQFAHVPGFDNCTACHDVHQLTVKFDQCTTCHQGITSVEDIRMSAGDYDGDAANEGLYGEITTMNEALLVAIQKYAPEKTGNAIAYNPLAYPYWFVDTNANGTVDPDEANSDNAFATWTPNLLRAAYNYQYVVKDPGAFAHNGKYVAQVLYDTLESVGGADAVAGMTRP